MILSRWYKHTQYSAWLHLPPFATRNNDTTGSGEQGTGRAPAGRVRGTGDAQSLRQSSPAAAELALWAPRRPSDPSGFSRSIQFAALMYGACRKIGFFPVSHRLRGTYAWFGKDARAPTPPGFPIMPGQRLGESTLSRGFHPASIHKCPKLAAMPENGRVFHCGAASKKPPPSLRRPRRRLRRCPACPVLAVAGG